MILFNFNFIYTKYINIGIYLFFFLRNGENDEDDDDKDEVSSTVSNLSELSGLSEISGRDWKPNAGNFNEMCINHVYI